MALKINRSKQMAILNCILTSTGKTCTEEVEKIGASVTC